VSLSIADWPVKALPKLDGQSHKHEEQQSRPQSTTSIGVMLGGFKILENILETSEEGEENEELEHSDWDGSAEILRVSIYDRNGGGAEVLGAVHDTSMHDVSRSSALNNGASFFESTEHTRSTDTHSTIDTDSSSVTATSNNGGVNCRNKKAGMPLFKPITETSAETMIWTFRHQKPSPVHIKSQERPSTVSRILKRLFRKEVQKDEFATVPLLSSKSSSRQPTQPKCKPHKRTKVLLMDQRKPARDTSRTTLIGKMRKQTSSGSFASAIGRDD
jgi:hypothetical protein